MEMLMLTILCLLTGHPILGTFALGWYCVAIISNTLD